MPSYEALVSVVDPAIFIRDTFMGRNKVFASKVKVERPNGHPRLVLIRSDDYLCVQDVLVVELSMSPAEADTYIVEA